MDVFVLNKDMETIHILNRFSSLIWTLRFNECGDFEIMVPMNSEIFNILKLDYYLYTADFCKDNRANLMIIETIEVDNSSETTMIKYTGRDLKSILDRRIVWGTKSFTKQTAVDVIIRDLVYENIIQPTDWSVKYANSYVNASVTNKVLDLDSKFNPIGPEIITAETLAIARVIDDFIFENHSRNNPAVSDDDLQYNNSSLYDIIVELCNKYKLGWDVLYDFSTNEFVFILKSRTDRTQTINSESPLVFATYLNNISDVQYLESSSNLKNAGLIMGKDPANNDIYQVYGENIKGLDRREMFISASTTSTDDTGRIDGNETYVNKLKMEFENELLNHKYVKVVDAKASNTLSYKYLEDYNLGDICELANDYGIDEQVVIDEVVLSTADGNISSIIPSFVAIDE